LNLKEFASTRGFQEDELAEWGVRVEGDEIIIPISGKNGAWYERTHRPGGNPKYLSPSGVESHLVNPTGLGPHSTEVWIAEGEFDCFSLLAVGAPAVGVLGTENFRREWALLFTKAKIVIALDPDEAGNRSANKIAQLWPQGQVTRFDPSPYEDINDWLVDDRPGLRRKVLEW